MRPQTITVMSVASLGLIAVALEVAEHNHLSASGSDFGGNEAPAPIATLQPEGSAGDLESPFDETTDAAPEALPETSPDIKPIAESDPEHGREEEPSRFSWYSGNKVATQYGIVQVSILTDKGKIVEVTTERIPDDSKESRRINRAAVPKLHQAAVEAQSANIDSISGATITSKAYKESLQSAMDKASGSEPQTRRIA